MGDPGLALRVAESAEKHAAHYRRAAAETFDLDLWESYTKAAEANELWAARVRECHAEYSVNENSPHAGNKGMNATNPESWFPRCRMAWLERYAKAAGHVGRGDLTATFGISPAQASSDLQAYLAENPDALTYSTSRKRYEWNDGASLAITPAPWEDFPCEELTRRLAASREKLEQIVVIGGQDTGVVLLSNEAVMEADGMTYKHVNFTPLGDALVDLHRSLSVNVSPLATPPLTPQDDAKR
jgi:hypothetical protein